MSGYIISPKADDDIFMIWEYLFGRASLELVGCLVHPKLRGAGCQPAAGC